VIQSKEISFAEIASPLVWESIDLVDCGHAIGSVHGFCREKVTKELFSLADNPRAMSLLSENQIAEIGRPCGLVNRKARAILATSKLLPEKFHGCVPETSKSWSRCLDWITKLLQLLWHKRFTGPHSQLTRTSLAYR
jgi:hypothetical protein